MSDIYLSVPGVSIEPGEVRASDRTSELGVGVVNLGGIGVHVSTAAAARVIAAAFTRVAEFHDARKTVADRDAERIRELESRMRELEGSAPDAEAQGGDPS